MAECSYLHSRNYNKEFQACVIIVTSLHLSQSNLPRPQSD